MDVYLGTICAFGFDFFPIDWAWCNGQTLPISSNPALYSLLGSFYGGDGKTTFGLPDLRGRAALGIGQGESFYTIGQSGGNNVTMLNQSNVPNHVHNLSVSLPCNNATADSNMPDTRYPANPDIGLLYNTAATDGVTMKSAAQVTIGYSPAATAPLDITDPYTALNYCICMRGEFPHRAE